MSNNKIAKRLAKLFEKKFGFRVLKMEFSGESESLSRTLKIELVIPGITRK